MELHERMIAGAACVWRFGGRGEAGHIVQGVVVFVVKTDHGYALARDTIMGHALCKKTEGARWYYVWSDDVFGLHQWFVGGPVWFVTRDEAIGKALDVIEGKLVVASY